MAKNKHTGKAPEDITDHFAESLRKALGRGYKSDAEMLTVLVTGVEYLLNGDTCDALHPKETAHIEKALEEMKSARKRFLAVARRCDTLDVDSKGD